MRERERVHDRILAEGVAEDKSNSFIRPALVVDPGEVQTHKIGIKYFRGVMKQTCTGYSKVFEVSKSNADWEEVFDNCTSIKEPEELEVI